MPLFRSLRVRIIIFIFASQLAVIGIFSFFLKNTNDRVNSENLSECETAQMNAVQAIDDTMYQTSNAVAMINTRIIRDPGPGISEQFFFYQDVQNFLDIFEYSSANSRIIHYYLYNSEDDYFLKSLNTYFDIYDKEALRESLRARSVADGGLSWQAVVLDDTTYFQYDIASEKYFLGVLIDCQELLNRYMITPSEASAMVTRQGQAVSSRQDSVLSPDGIFSLKDMDRLLQGGTEYRIRRTDSAYGYSIVSAVPVTGALLALRRNPRILYAFFLYSLLMLVLLFVFLNKTILAPVDYILFAFSRVSSGDLTFRAQEKIFSTEFQTINRSFNLMIRQIRDLKMDYYEEKIRQQEYERRYLQAISYPHFLLNNLNMINTFAYQKNEAGIHEAVLGLSQYLRSNMNSSSKTHTLINDVNTTESYLNLCMLAYPGRISYTLSRNERLLYMHFPPLIISTIVENCVKHGLLPDQSLRIALVLDVTEQGGEECFCFTAFNSASQFPAEVLEDSRKPDGLADKENSHIGLAYVKNTLRHLFEDKALFSIENRPDGAIVTILIPLSALEQYENSLKGSEAEAGEIL